MSFERKCQHHSSQHDYYLFSFINAAHAVPLIDPLQIIIIKDKTKQF